MKQFLVFAATAFAFGFLIESSKAAHGFCYKQQECGQYSNLWGGACKTGRAQSPININKEWENPQRENIVFNSEYKNGVDSVYIINNGHTIQASISPDATSRMTFITSLFPDDIYVFGQVHCHWSGEHEFYDKYFDLECHLVHYNSRYSSISEAVESGTDGALAIFGIVYKTTRIPENEALKVFTENIEKIRRPTEGQAIPVETRLNLLEMLLLGLDPSQTEDREIEAFQYEGSLTTPQCNEGMHWFVLKEPQLVSEKQIDLINEVFGGDGELMRNNRRYLQPLNGRVVRDVSLRVL